MQTSLLSNATIHNLHPTILTIDNFLSDSYCDAIVAAAKPGTRQATVYTQQDGPERSSSRTNSTCLLDPKDYPLIREIFADLGAIVCLPVENAEGLSVLHYSKGQEFKPHFDAFELDGSPRHKLILEKGGGQRLFTAICYLNDGFLGGETSFPKAGVSIAPRKGRLLIFANTPAGSNEQSPASLHTGTPVTEGEKWAATVWWRERRFPYDLLRAANAGQPVAL